MGTWSHKDTVGTISVALELGGFYLVFAASTVAYQLLGWALVVLGVVPWSLPHIRAAIAEERRRDERPQR